MSEEVHEPIWYTGFDQPCSDFEVRIERSPDGELPLSLSLGVDGSCVPAGIARVTWQLGDELLEGEEVEITLLASGEVPVLATVEDQTGQIATAETLVRVFPQSCPDVDPNLVLGTVGTGAIVEASGLAHSVGRPGVLWTHNDSGAVGDLFALDEQGVLLETVELDIHSGDWEDLAYGWTAAGDWTLFVGDVGDNAEAREHIRVYLVPEEDPQSYGEMELRYPGGLSHNCESITLDPVSGDLLVITKDYAGDTQVFVKPSPHLNGDKAELVWLADLDTGAAPYSGSAATTAADFSPLGNLLAVRTYTDVWLFRRDQSESLEAIFEREPCDGLAPGEQQGESIAFATDGSGYFLLSEGQNQPLNFVPLD